MANATGSGLRFIQKALKKMEETDVIVKMGNGAYMMNPDVLFKGKYPSRKKAITQYEYYKAQQKERQKKKQERKQKRPDKNAIYLVFELCYYNYRQTKKLVQIGTLITNF